jgi:hypothetical protein
MPPKLPFKRRPASPLPVTPTDETVKGEGERCRRPRGDSFFLRWPSREGGGGGDLRGTVNLTIWILLQIPQ